MKVKHTANYVIGYDGGDHVIFHDGEVVYENDRVVFVGHHYPGEVDQECDEGQAIISPGFVDLNALGDIDTTLARSLATDRNGLRWSEAYLKAGPQDAMTPEEDQLKGRYALVQLLLNGITTALPVTGLGYKGWAETAEEYAHLAEFAVQIGLRAYMGPSYRSGVEYVRRDGSLGNYWDEARGIEGFEGARRFIMQYQGFGGDLIRGLLVPSQFQTCTPDLLRKTKALSDELDCPIRLHAAQSAREFAFSMREYGQTPIAFLHSLGFLGPRIFIPHTTHVSGASVVDVQGGDDQMFLRDTGTTVVHCPLVLAGGGALLESFDRFSQMGISIAMGTDTFPPDMIECIRMGNIQNQMVHGGSAEARPADFYRAATLGGAQALGREDLGRLAPGSKADMIVLSLESMYVGQYDDPIETMVLGMNSRDISKVVIDGRVVMQDGLVPGVEMQALRAQAQDYYWKLKQSFTQRDYKQRTLDALFETSFRVVPSDSEG